MANKGITKKQLIEFIQFKLQELGIKENGCQSFGVGIDLPNGNKLGWVGYKKFLFLKKDIRLTSLYYSKQIPFDSREATKDILLIICNWLKEHSCSKKALPKKKVRIKFSADVVIEADTLEECREKWEGMPLFSKEALACGAEYSETLLIEDDETYEDLSDDWY